MAPTPLRDRPLAILIAHGDAEARREIHTSLSETGVACREVTSGAECLRLALAEPPDLVILDLYLPDQSGLGVCRLIRETPELERVPIMVVAAQASEIDRVLAFESGADDFLPRPFYAPELRARVDAVIRGFRSRPSSERPARLGRGMLQIDTRMARASVDGTRIDLTHKEFELLAALATHAGRVVRRRQLIRELWGADASQSDRAIDAHIKSIRRKLGPARDCIETVRGVGYRFVDPQEKNGSAELATWSEDAFAARIPR
jgi:two-component system phosphate regulon response regulator PhoB